MTDPTRLPALREQLRLTADGLTKLTARSAELVVDLAEAERATGRTGWRDFLSDGIEALDGPDAETIGRDLAQVDHLIAVGRADQRRIRDQVREIERAEQAAIDAAMTWEDAVAFAREALAALDLDGVAGELRRIEAEAGALDQPRLNARHELTDANAALDIARRRLGDRVDEIARSAVEPARLAAELARQRAADLRDEVRDLEAEHRERRDGLQRGVARAFVHVARILSQNARQAEQAAKALDTIARDLKLPRRPLTGTLPDVAMPPIAAIDELANLAAPALKLAAAKLERPRPESEYLARSPSGVPTAGRRAA